jgi:Lar family restriction alleviation protein
MTALKPCPFCGSTHVELFAESLVVLCHQCGAENPDLPIDGATVEDVVAAWNRRAGEDALRTEAERLREALRNLINAIEDEEWEDAHREACDLLAGTHDTAKTDDEHDVCLDFPTAWALAHEVAHHAECSYAACDGAILCDCGAIEAEAKRRAHDTAKTDGGEG